MKRRYLGAGACLAAFLSFAVPASADTSSGYFYVGLLDNGDGGTFGTLTVTPASGAFTGSSKNPHSCTTTAFAVQMSSLSATAKELNNKVLLAAYLGGKRVSLLMASTHCMNAGAATTSTTGAPGFYSVSIAD